MSIPGNLLIAGKNIQLILAAPQKRMKSSTSPE